MAEAVEDQMAVAVREPTRAAGAGMIVGEVRIAGATRAAGVSSAERQAMQNRTAERDQSYATSVRVVDTGRKCTTK